MDAARFDEPDVEEAAVDGVDSAVADRLFRSGVRGSYLSGVVGVALVRSVSLARPLRCFETFFDVRTVDDDIFRSILPRTDLACFVDATFIFLVEASTSGVARDFFFVFFIRFLAWTDAV